jgi:ethanolamine utilization protein EutM
VADTAVGMVECRGMVATMVAVEAMCKAANVVCVLVERVSGGVLVAVVKGDLASVQHAVEVGSAAAARYGELRNAKVFPRPTDEFADLLGGSVQLGGSVELGGSAELVDGESTANGG